MIIIKLKESYHETFASLLKLIFRSSNRPVMEPIESAKTLLYVRKILYLKIIFRGMSSETIIINQVDLAIENFDFQLSDVKMSPSRGAGFCECLKLETKSDSYMKVRCTTDGDGFRFVFYLNKSITGVSTRYTTSQGNIYMATAKQGHKVGIYCTP